MEIEAQDQETVTEPIAVSDIERWLSDARRELLDLTTRNRLIHTPRGRARSKAIEIVDERTEHIHRLLVTEKKAFTFLPREEEPVGDRTGDETVTDLPTQPTAEEEARESEAPDPRHVDLKLQTALPPEQLQRKLLRLSYDARTFQEEQGVNVLYLAIGFLKWREIDRSDVDRFAPLILVPVELERRSAASRFRLRWTGEDVTTNLSLQAKLKVDFGIELPEIADPDNFDPLEYLLRVDAAITAYPTWDVLEHDMTLAFFSFARLLMYRDLDPENWPGETPLTEQPLLCAMAREGFEPAPPLFGEAEPIDRHLPPLQTIHVLNADSSQAQVIEEARQGRNLIVQGPPGTGKSQTIANIIAASVCAGKRVLFVAEKMAALDVVHRRLERVGLGEMCLQLHSNKARKRDVLHQLAHALEADPPRVDGVEQNAADLQRVRQEVNEHARRLHTPHEPSGLTPYAVVGELVQLRAHGVEPARIDFEACATWRPGEARQRQEIIDDLVTQTQTMGLAAEHPWRGSMLDASLPTDRDRLGQALPSVAEKLDGLTRSGADLSTVLKVPTARSLAEVDRLVAVAGYLVAAPKLMDRSALGDQVWVNRRADIAALTQAGRRLEQCFESLEGRIVDAAWSLDLTHARLDLAATGRSFFRFLIPRYRRAMSALRSILTGPPPRSLDDRLSLLDSLNAAREARSVVQAHSELGASAFGSLWRGERSQWGILSEIEAWEHGARSIEGMPATFCGTVAELAEPPATLKPLAERCRAARGEAAHALRRVFEQVRLDLTEAFDVEADESTLEAIDLERINRRVAHWQDALDELPAWIRWRIHRDQAVSGGLSDLVTALADGAIEATQAPAHFRMVYCEAVLRSMMHADPALGSFSGQTHERLLDRFSELDEQRVQLARAQAARAHWEQIPRGGAGIGEMGLLRHEIGKKRRHLPLRRLLREAGEAITRIKPVFMMSPMSIATYVEPGALQFDVLLIDEASQIKPVDGLGAIARAQQIVVVGDDKQLPPTTFFDRFEANVDEEDGLVESAGDLESILDLCHAKGISDRMLRWHYRSRHHSLIAVSNREFYDNRLYVIPSPFERNEELGLVFHHVADAIYQRGAGATNPVEARTIAEAVMRHAAEQPHLSLGVGAFSVRQRDAILDEVERLRRRHPGCEPFFDRGRLEPFFVKNLENIQGDERDVIYVSVGYGRDEDGRLSMHFGPLSNEGGHRRLNVLMTRARSRCEVFSSITDEDIDLSRTTGRGPAAFKTFLAYARSGEITMPRITGRGHDSPFEQAVAQAIAACGYEAEAQVGVAGFFIDLAVRDPDHPGRFLLGVECDGATYHSALSARDRDRTRGFVLRDRGWTLHRIWSTDWFNNPDEEVRELAAAIEAARAEAAAGLAGAGEVAEEDDDDPDHFELPRDATDQKTAEQGSTPYREASFHVSRARDIHEVRQAKLAEIVTRIVEVEGPIHTEEIAQRVSTLWGQSRTGSRVRRAVHQGVARAVRDGEVRLSESCLLPAGQTQTPVRDRSSVQSRSLRRPGMLPPMEIRQCLRELVARHVSAGRDELITTCARRLGYRSTSSRLRGVIDAQIERLTDAGALVEEDEQFRSPASPGL